MPGRRVFVTGLMLSLAGLLACALAVPGAARATAAATTHTYAATTALSFFPTAVTASESRAVPGHHAPTARLPTVFAPEDSAGIDLQAAEDAGGHTLARHVGLTAEQLMARNIPYASTFTDLSAAETATGDNLAANESVITKWLAGTSSRLAIQNGMDSSGGIIYQRATQSFISPSAVNTVLVRTATGYNILTSYPIP